MTLHTLNAPLLEYNFMAISKHLETHLDKLKKDANEMNVTLVSLYVKKVYKLLNDLDSALKDKTIAFRDLGTIIEKNIKQLNFLKDKIVPYVKKWEDNEFEKDATQELIKILQDLVIKIDKAISSAEEKDKALIKKIADEASKEATKHGRKIPVGLSQDLKTKKHIIAKNKK